MITHGITDQTAALVEQGIAAMKAGNREGATAAFRLVIEMDPNNETAWLWMTSLYTELPLIAQCLQQVVRINPANEQANRALEAVMQKLQAQASTPPAQQMGNSGPLTGQALAAKNHAHATQNNSGSLHFEELKRRGIVAAKGGRYAEAKEYLVAAVEQNESDVEAWYWLSTVIDDPEDKQIALENVLILDPTHDAANTAMQANAPALERHLLAKQKVGGTGYASNAGQARIATENVQQPTTRNTTLNLSSTKTFKTDSSMAMPHGVESGLSEGQVIADKYTVLGRARSGSDFVAWDARKRRFYILRPVQGDMGQIGAASSEVKVTHEGVLYTVMPIDTKGLSLSSVIRTVGALPPILVAEYGLAMLKTLEAEQARNPNASVQKSLRPDTITLDAQGNILLEPPSANHVTMSLSNDAAPYMPPEQLERGLVSSTSDIYSIGAIMYSMLTGSPPPRAERIHVGQQAGAMHINFDSFPNVPTDLAQIIATALQPDPLERYPSPMVMQEAIKALETNQQTKKSFGIPQIAVVAAVIGIAVLGLAFIVNNLGGVKLPGILGNNQAADLTPTSVPIVVANPTPTPPPLGRVIINAVDSRRFPANAVYVSALDDTGVPITGLTADSVKLRENGAEVTSLDLTGLHKTTDSISVIVALDTSDKMSGATMDNAKTAMHILADYIQPGDHLALLTFGGSAQLVVPNTVSKSAFLLGVDRQEAGDKRALEEVFGLASTMAKEQPQGGYTALIVITNGDLPAKEDDLNKLVSPANGANLPVFFLGLDPATYPGEAATLLASKTGGVALVPEKADTGLIGEAMKKIEKQLHYVYKLTYASEASGFGADHNLEIEVSTHTEPKTDKRAYQVWPKQLP